jgi:hypothetical protein
MTRTIPDLIIDFLLSLMGVCRHSHSYRDRDIKGRVTFVCEGCGRAVLALERTPAERKAMMKRYPIPPSLKANETPAKVMPIRRAK